MIARDTVRAAEDIHHRRQGLAAFVAGLLGVCLAACTATVPEPTAADIARAQSHWPDLEPEDLAAGRSLYVNRCGNCHRLERPASRSPEIWPRKIDAMSARAGLSQHAQELVTRYVVTMAERAELARLVTPAADPPSDDATP